jgi:hypothetical protein
MTARSSVQIPHSPGPKLRMIAGRLRMVYHQLDGELELADACTCTLDYREVTQVSPAPCRCCAVVGFRVRRNPDCPIDEHRIAALKARAA